MKLHFTKMQGAGNDFVVLDETRGRLHLTPAQYRFLADRHFGVGADQILSVRAAPAPGVDFAYAIHNANGGEVEHCGNGARCFVRYVREHGLTDQRTVRVTTRIPTAALADADSAGPAVAAAIAAAGLSAPVFKIAGPFAAARTAIDKLREIMGIHEPHGVGVRMLAHVAHQCRELQWRCRMQYRQRRGGVQAPCATGVFHEQLRLGVPTVALQALPQRIDLAGRPFQELQVHATAGQQRAADAVLGVAAGGLLDHFGQGSFIQRANLAAAIKQLGHGVPGCVGLAARHVLALWKAPRRPASAAAAAPRQGASEFAPALQAPEGFATFARPGGLGPGATGRPGGACAAGRPARGHTARWAARAAAWLPRPSARE